MRILFILCILSLCTAYCTMAVRRSAKKEKFIATTHSLPNDTTIFSIASYKGYIIAAQNNGKLMILDSTYQRQKQLEDRLNKGEIQQLFTWHDTVLLTFQNKSYYINEQMGLKEYDTTGKNIHGSMWEDDNYSINACCAGEWGGSVFFNNKHNNKIYSYQATCAVQVLPYKNGYWVCENLAHLSKRTDFTFLQDPKNTYELTDSLNNHCNWWVDVDSLKDYWRTDSIKGVHRIHGPLFSMTVSNFIHNDSLYAIISNDTCTYLNVLRNDSLVIADTLFRHPLNFHTLKTIQVGSKTISLLNLTSGSPVEAYFFRGNSSALLIADGNKIDLLLKK